MVRVAFMGDTIRKDGSVVPKLVEKKTITFEAVLDIMRIQTGLSESDMSSVFMHLIESLVLLLPQGNQVKTPLGTFSLSLRRVAGTGTTSLNNTVSTDRLSFKLRPDSGLVSRLRAATSVEVVAAPAPQLPAVLRSDNTEQEGLVNKGSVGEVIHITGTRLSFQRKDQETGVFFIGVDTLGETRVTAYSHIGSNFIDFKIPTLAPGNYNLEVRTRPTDKSIRVTATKIPFLVA